MDLRCYLKEKLLNWSSKGNHYRSTTQSNEQPRTKDSEEETSVDQQELIDCCEISSVILLMCKMCIQVLQCFISVVSQLLLLLAGDVETNPGPEMTVNALITELETLTKPVEFGISLGIPLHQVEIIIKQEHSVDRQKIALFQYIVENYNSLGISWSSIASAVYAIDQNLSTSMAEKYCSAVHDDHVLTIEDLKQKYRLSDSFLYSELAENNLHSLAGCFDNVEDYLDALELTEGQQTDVKDIAYKKSIQIGMTKALKLWRRRNPLVSTYSNLLILLLKLRKGDVACKCCDLMYPKFLPGSLDNSQSVDEGTPLTEEDSDALEKLLLDNRIGGFALTGERTYEKIVHHLRDLGYEELAANLRPNLDKVIREQKRYLKKLDDLITGEETMYVQYVKLFLVGPPCVGKTTTLSRLLKDIENISSAVNEAKLRSTLLTNCHQVLAYMNKDATEWVCSKDVEEEAKLLFGYMYSISEVNEVVSVEKTITVPVKPRPKSQKEIHTKRSEIQEKAYQQNRLILIKARLQKLIKNGNYSQMAKCFGNTMLNINDVGGQPAFLEMLPALCNGPAMYLVFLDLSKEVDKPYYIPFSRDNTVITPFKAVHTVEATVSQILSAVASIHHVSREDAKYKTTSKLSEKFEKFKQVRPVAALIGTHMDKLENPKEKIKQVNDALKATTQKFAEILVSPPSDSESSFFAVDNFTGTEQSDITPIRDFISEVCASRFSYASLPIKRKWLLLGTLLRMEYSIASMEDCLEIGRLLEMGEEDTKCCLWYLQKIGFILHYRNVPNDDYGWLGNHIFCSPEVIFTSISQLILVAVRILHSSGHIIEFERSELIKMGQFTLEAIIKYCNGPDVTKMLKKGEIIPAKHLVILLQYLNLLSEIVHKDANDPKVTRITYLMPAILDCASQEELTNPPQPDSNNPEPLHITFNFGYVPTGVFCGLITRIVSQGPHGILGLTWKLVEDGVKRNCVSFLVDGVHKVTLLSHDKSYEIRVERYAPDVSLHDICSHSLSAILYLLKIMFPNLSLGVAFQCSCPTHAASKSLDNLCTLVQRPKIHFLCGKSPVTLNQGQQVWLGKHVSPGSSTQLKVLKFAEDGFSFHWTKEGSRRQIVTTTYEPNALNFQTVSEEDFSHYQCEVEQEGKLVLTVYRALYKEETSSSFIISNQPKDVCCKPGNKAKFIILTSPPAIRCMYQWYFENQTIAIQNSEYKGQTSNCLLIIKFLPKHKGVYCCVAEDASGSRITSQSAALTADGERVKQQELQFIGKHLEKSAVDFSNYGIEMVHLINGDSDVTYEEITFILNENPSTQVLSTNLKQEISSKMEEERLYAKAIQEKFSVSLTYTKILALGPGQVGKSTFVRRLLGIMKGNILTSPPETQPQCTTGIIESREACIMKGNILTSAPETQPPSCILESREACIMKGNILTSAPETQPPSGILESRETCIQYTRLTGAITGAINNRKWCVLQDELHDQLSGLMSLIVKQSKQGPQPEATRSSSNSRQKASKKTVVKESLVDVAVSSKKDDKQLSCDTEFIEKQTAVSESFSDTTQEPNATEFMPRTSESDISKTIRDFKKLEKECTPVSVDFEVLFNVADVGGQPAFLEMLPSLTIGPALYLVFMNLKQGLTSRHSVQFKCKNSEIQLCCKNYSYTSEEVIFTALSSIACFGHSDEEVEKYVKPASDNEKRKDSFALLVGTFSDEIKDEELKYVTSQLEKRLEDTAFYKEGLINCKSFSLLVNNMSAEDSEIEDHRRLLEHVLRYKFREYQIPTQWLLLSICLKLLARNQNRYHVSFDDCILLGEYLDMDKNMVRVALKFLHKYIGLVMYFPDLENLVICDPQVVFSTISELIFNVYDHNSSIVIKAKCDHFVETGCFSPQDINIENLPVNEEKKKLLSIDKLVDLLVYLNIAAKVPSSSAEQEYFLPAVLHAADSETNDFKRSKKGINEELLPEPICIRFKTGYLPLGFVCALIANLIVENKFDLLFGENNKLYKNMITFRFRGILNVTVISWPRYCEFRVNHVVDELQVSSYSGKLDFWNKDCCPLIREIIYTAAIKVIQSMQHGFPSVHEVFDLAFHCPRHPNAELGQESLAKLVGDHTDKNFVLKEAKCTKCKIAIHPLTPEMMVWFGEVPNTPLSIAEQPAREGNVISIKADGVRPLKYEWFLWDEKLCDRNVQNCGGYTTCKLVVNNKDLLSEGVFKCRVQNKFGICVESDELDLFEEELRKTWKLHKEEIRKIKKHGFKSIWNFQDVELVDLDLNTGEMLRMKDLLNYVQGKSASETSLSVAESSPVRAQTFEIEEFLAEATATQLSQECSNEALLHLSTKVAGYSKYKHMLGLSDAEIEAIDQNPDTVQSIPGRFYVALKQWRSKNIDFNCPLKSTATYSQLIEIAKKIKDGETIREIHKACVKYNPSL